MTQVQYTNAVGTKFHPDGTLRHFPGNTIVSMALMEPLFSELQWAQEQIKAAPFAGKFSCLPPSSFHMTVIELLCDQVRKPTHWSGLLPLDMPIEQTDAAFRELLASVDFPDNLVMEPTGVSLGQAVTIRLQPADVQTAEALQQFRDTVARVTGVRFPNHDTYKFHITLAYNIIKMTPDEESAFDRMRRVIVDRLQRAVATFTLSAPQLVLFNDMGEFAPNLVRASG